MAQCDLRHETKGQDCSYAVAGGRQIGKGEMEDEDNPAGDVPSRQRDLGEL